MSEASAPAAATVSKAGTAQSEKPKVHGLSYFFFYCVLFFAYWFGSSAFDFDGDGDFDPEDVQAWMASKGFLPKKYVKPRRPRTAQKRTASTPATPATEVPATEVAAAGKPGLGKEALEEPTTGKDKGDDGVLGLDDLLAVDVDGEAQEQQLLNALKRGVLPYFVIFECLVIFGFWLGFMIKAAVTNASSNPIQMKAGLDDVFPHKTELRWFGSACEDQSVEVWRWLSYQFTHVGAMHVSMNIFLIVMLGLPLEGIHGGWRMAIMFNVGVVGGGWNYYLMDAHRSVVGASGGCYALIGIQLADLVMNWHQKKFRFPTLFLLIFLAAVDLVSYYMSLSSESSSHAAHIGGAVAGLLIGILVCRNMKKKMYECVIMVLALIVLLGVFGFSISWIFTQREGGPGNLWDAPANRWCWFRAVYARTIDEFNWVCVRCSSASCVERMLANFTPHVGQSTLEYCNGRGWWYSESG